MLSLTVLVFSTGQKRVLKKTLKYLRKRVDFDHLTLRWLAGDDFVDHPDIDNQQCRSFIRETGLFDYCYFPETNQGLGHMVNHLYEKVVTPYVLHLEHDWKFIKRIELKPLLEIMETHADITCIRFNKKITKAAPLVFWVDDPGRTRMIQGLALTQTKSWTFNPTLYRTDHVKKVLPIANSSSERSFKAKMDVNEYRCYSLGKPGDVFVKHLSGISCGRY